MAVYTLSNSKIKVEILNYGATIKAIYVQNDENKIINVALGYKTTAEYKKHDGYLGATIGRVSNRIKNDGDNTLHGGQGFNKAIFKVVKIEPNSVILRYVSKDGEAGFNGNLTLDVCYSIADKELAIEYRATSDELTVFSPTNHTYFNLSGSDNNHEDSISQHELCINADNFLPVDDNLIPTGEIRSVKNTPFDFTSFKPIGRDINANYEQLAMGNGYDHNFCLNTVGSFNLCAEAYCPVTKIKMQVLSDMKGLQFYSGNFLDGSNGFKRRSGFCLETQSYPNTVNTPSFGSIALEKNKEFYSKTVYKFSIKG